MKKSLTACPMLNTLVHSKKLAKTKVTKSNITEALKYIKCDPIIIFVLSTFFPVNNITDLNKPGNIEHDLSLTRLDNSNGNSVILNIKRFHIMKSFSKDSHYIELDEIISYMNYLRKIILLIKKEL